MATMATASALSLLVVLLTASSCAFSRDFYVGGRDGWTTNPGEPYNRWAERNRFQVNDTLVFRYDKDVDAVLWVSQSHYDGCNTSEPFFSLTGGHSRFVFGTSGPYFFISADAARCRAGERLIVVVLAVRDDRGSSSNVPSPVPLPSWSPPPDVPSSPRPSTPRLLPPPPPPSSPSTGSASPPPPSPSAAGNASSSLPPAASPFTAPVPAAGTNGTCAPSTSSAVALRAGVLACLLLLAGGAAIL